ncbi:tRNA (adenosine(37)-N6)-threonylcarbamoyltransferase complex ATPase subunit type 1 TsaE [Shouchella lonarensis]|uniref:tRNA threonylcarbamoyladenosine biosynthesis protein TsaE n=1 Tax=Shouchella lonarensis TaxID=1464122 RepID=A0A1G6I0K3_9BACI|nr:tRNA (adenosine(37)-N6)-threonylcarbamoyltransferase complex ATPase subunit type 1 TsaE [Shouchella lonarensis]SDB99994.1 tRNA threonylcarbamoyladenosine biosynthesis protein TsaE [Shouchella lonarensis]
MTKQRFKTNTVAETLSLAEKLGTLLQAGDVLTLDGDLGAGKTHFTKGLAAGLGVTKMVTSPTFTIIKEYDGRIPLYHMDVYRLEGQEDDLGLSDYFYGDGVTVVEWAHLIEEQLPKERLACTMTTEGETVRLLTFQALGRRYEKRLEEMER